MAKIESRNGQTTLVDLGAPDRLQQNLRSGQQISVQGVAVRSGDQNILVANQIHRNGTTHSIDRAASGQAQSQNNRM